MEDFILERKGISLGFKLGKTQDPENVETLIYISRSPQERINIREREREGEREGDRERGR